MADFKHSLGFNISSEGALVKPTKYQTQGFTAGYKLPAPHFNWIVDKTSKCITEIQQTHNALESQFKSAMNIRNLHTYTSLSQIGLSGKVTMTDIFGALNKRGQCMLVLGNTNAEGSENYVSDTPTQFGTLVVTHYAAARTMAQFWKADDGHVHQYIGKYHTTEGWSGWFETFTEAHPPTPEEVGALSINGGTITGDLTINGGNLAVSRKGGTSRVFNHDTSPITYLQQVTKEGKIVEIALNAETNTLWLAMGNDVNSLTWYRIYNEFHKPTLAELKAQGVHYYYDPAHFGCSVASTLNEVWTKLPNMSVFVYAATDMTDASWNLPKGYGIIRMEKFNVNRGCIHYYTKDSGISDYRMYLNNADGSPTGVWVKVYDEAHKPTPAEIGASPSNHSHGFGDISGVVPINKGGTGATEIGQARTNLDFKSGYYMGDGNSAGSNYTKDLGCPNSNLIFIYANSGGNDFYGFLNPNGGFMVDVWRGALGGQQSEIYYFGSDADQKASYANGVLAIRSNSVYINANNVKYSYQCL